MTRSARPAESEMLLPMLRGLIRVGWAQQMSPAALELRWHQKRMDLAFTSESRGVVSVELKVSKWRKAIDQAYVNRWASNYAIVGIWHDCITSDTYRYAEHAGVGLVAVTRNTIYPLTLPDPSPRPEVADRFDRELRLSGRKLRDLLTFALDPTSALA